MGSHFEDYMAEDEFLKAALNTDSRRQGITDAAESASGILADSDCISTDGLRLAARLVYETSLQISRDESHSTEYLEEDVQLAQTLLQVIKERIPGQGAEVSARRLLVISTILASTAFYADQLNGIPDPYYNAAGLGRPGPSTNGGN